MLTSASSPFSKIWSAAQTMWASYEVPPLVLPRLESASTNSLSRSREIGLMVMVDSAWSNRLRLAFASQRSFTWGFGKVADSRLASPQPFGIPSLVAQLIFPLRPLIRVISVSVARDSGFLHRPLSSFVSGARSLR